MVYVIVYCGAGKVILHREGCGVIDTDSNIYVLGDFPGYARAYEDAVVHGYESAVGCYWCCFWNHTSDAGLDDDLTNKTVS